MQFIDDKIGGTPQSITNCVWCDAEFEKGTFNCTNPECTDGNIQCNKCGHTFHIFNVACDKCGEIY